MRIGNYIVRFNAGGLIGVLFLLMAVIRITGLGC